MLRANSWLRCNTSDTHTPHTDRAEQHKSGKHVSYDTPHTADTTYTPDTTHTNNAPGAARGGEKIK